MIPMAGRRTAREGTALDKIERQWEHGRQAVPCWSACDSGTARRGAVLGMERQAANALLRTDPPVEPA
eukprot:SAG22_NODE_116_length_19306_cov_247.696517_19_plen_68_part_00